MKKTLAILLVALLALTSVFAGERTLTLKSEVTNVAPTFNVFYGKEENPETPLGASQVENNVDLTKGETNRRYFTVKINANSAENAPGMYVKFANTPFLHESITPENVATVADNMKVDTELSFVEMNNVLGVETSISIPGPNSKQVDVNYTQFNKINNEIVAKGTLTWTNDQDLVAGKYTSTVTVTISNE